MLRQFVPSSDANVLVATETSDDAAVYRLSDELAIVSTLDYITPVVDDPFIFGQVAAANSLSDVWAMGARPLFALNLVGFPVETLPQEVLGEIMRGGQTKAAEAGVPILGGHTIRDEEPKYGLAVTGSVRPDRVVRNSTAQPGDVLILTKPLGIGIITTAIKRDLAAKLMVDRAVEVMTALNRGAGEAIVATGVSAATDITGFGLLGHLREMTAGSGVSAEIASAAVPVIDGVRALALDGVVPGGSRDNLAFLEAGGTIEWADSLAEADRLILADAQTSGGLLIAVPQPKADQLREALQRNGALASAEIGRIIERDTSGRIRVRA